MKSVLISIQPKWCELIASGKKTIEVRKTKPKLDTPFKVYIYCTKPKGKNDIGLCLDNGKVGYVFKRNYETAQHFEMPILSGKVIGEFVCDEIYDIGYSPYNHGGFISDTDSLYEKSCLDLEAMFNYLSQGYGYGWHISNLVIYDKPVELYKFHRECERPECEDCLYLHFENTPNSYEGWCEYDEKIPIKRPPQSWCYVESEVTE